MSKRLPYYQSEPAEYLAGDIMFCSYAAQGVFTILRALYWQRDCNLMLSQAKRRIINSDALFKELVNENIIKVLDDDICINFLDEQFEKASGKAKANSENGKKGAAKRWANKGVNSESIATPLIRYNESIALREDKEDKEDDIKTTKEIKNIDVVYTVVEFLKDWNIQRTEHLKKPSFLNRLNHDDLLNFNDLAKDYKGEDFNYALIGLFKQKKLPNGNTSMQSNPKHFLTHFNSYLTAFHDKNNSLYGKQENNLQTL